MSCIPDFHLSAIHKPSGRSAGKLGAGWMNNDGSVSIVLDPCVVLSGNDDISIRLFPSGGARHAPKRNEDPAPKIPNMDEEIPF